MTWIDIIIKVKPGETICLTTDPPSIVIHNTWSTFFYRYWYVENRHKLLTWITQMAYEYLDEHKNFLDVMQRRVFYKVADGIRNLAATYAGTEINEPLCNLSKKFESRLYFINWFINENSYTIHTIVHSIQKLLHFSRTNITGALCISDKSQCRCSAIYCCITIFLSGYSTNFYVHIEVYSIIPKLSVIKHT